MATAHVIFNKDISRFRRRSLSPSVILVLTLSFSGIVAAVSPVCEPKGSALEYIGDLIGWNSKSCSPASIEPRLSAMDNSYFKELTSDQRFRLNLPEPQGDRLSLGDDRVQRYQQRTGSPSNTRVVEYEVRSE